MSNSVEIAHFDGVLKRFMRDLNNIGKSRAFQTQ